MGERLPHSYHAPTPQQLRTLSQRPQYSLPAAKYKQSVVALSTNHPTSPPLTPTDNPELEPASENKPTAMNHHRTQKQSYSSLVSENIALRRKLELAISSVDDEESRHVGAPLLAGHDGVSGSRRSSFGSARRHYAESLPTVDEIETREPIGDQMSAVPPSVAIQLQSIEYRTLFALEELAKERDDAQKANESLRNKLETLQAMFQSQQQETQVLYDTWLQQRGHVEGTTGNSTEGRPTGLSNGLDVYGRGVSAQRSSSTCPMSVNMGFTNQQDLGHGVERLFTEVDLGRSTPGTGNQHARISQQSQALPDSHLPASDPDVNRRPGSKERMARSAKFQRPNSLTFDGAHRNPVAQYFESQANVGTQETLHHSRPIQYPKQTLRPSKSEPFFKPQKKPFVTENIEHSEHWAQDDYANIPADFSTLRMHYGMGPPRSTDPDQVLHLNQQHEQEQSSDYSDSSALSPVGQMAARTEYDRDELFINRQRRPATQSPVSLEQRAERTTSWLSIGLSPVLEDISEHQAEDSYPSSDIQRHGSTTPAKDRDQYRTASFIQQSQDNHEGAQVLREVIPEAMSKELTTYPERGKLTRPASLAISNLEHSSSMDPLRSHPVNSSSPAPASGQRTPMGLRSATPTSAHRHNLSTAKSTTSPTVKAKRPYTALDAVAVAMIGEWMWKHVTSKRTASKCTERHKRWVWLSPSDRTLMWASRPPNTNASYHGFQIGRSRKLAIRSVLDVRDDGLPSSVFMAGSLNVFDRAIVVVTPERSLKFSAMNAERHNLWMTALGVMAQSTNPHAPDLESLLPGDEGVIDPPRAPSTPTPLDQSVMRSGLLSQSVSPTKMMQTLPPGLSLDLTNPQSSSAQNEGNSQPLYRSSRIQDSATPRLGSLRSNRPLSAVSTASSAARRGFVFPGGTRTDDENMFMTEEEEEIQAMHQSDALNVGALRNDDLQWSAGDISNIGEKGTVRMSAFAGLR